MAEETLAGTLRAFSITPQQRVNTGLPFAIAADTARQVSPMEGLLQGARLGGLMGTIASERQRRDLRKLQIQDASTEMERAQKMRDIINQSVTVNAETGDLELDRDRIKAGLLAGGLGEEAFQMDMADQARQRAAVMEAAKLANVQAQTFQRQATGEAAISAEQRARALAPLQQQQARQDLAQAETMAPLEQQRIQAQIRAQQATARQRQAQARAAERESAVPEALKRDKDLQRVIFTQFGGEMTPTNVAAAQNVLETERADQKERELVVSQQVKQQYPVLNPMQQRNLGSTNTKLAVANTMADSFRPSEIQQWVGFLRGRISRVSQLAQQNRRFAEFQSLVGRLRASILFDRQEGGGGALTPTELQALEASIPTGLERGGVPEFRAKLQQMQTILRTNLETQTQLPSMTPQQAQVFLARQREQLQRGLASTSDVDSLIADHTRE